MLIPAALVAVPAPALAAAPFLAERVYVETTRETDGDGAPDRIALDITRPAGAAAVPSILELTPYAEGINDVADFGLHPVDVPRLAQETAAQANTPAFDEGPDHQSMWSGSVLAEMAEQYLAEGYATITGHSLGTGSSNGCPGAGSDDETQARVAVIDWLNGRATGFTALTGGTPVTASWSTGKVGMSGISYPGGLANQVASTGVEGLAAIVPVAAISDWYDYHRANGLVVGPQSGQAADSDVLAKGVVKKGRCQARIDALTRDQGREHGDRTRTGRSATTSTTPPASRRPYWSCTAWPTGTSGASSTPSGTRPSPAPTSRARSCCTRRATAPIPASPANSNC